MKQCTFSLELEAASAPIGSSDTIPSSQSSGTNMPAESCASEQTPDGFQDCMCGKGTSDCSIHPHTPAEYIASMQDSLAKILAMQENKLESARKREADCIGKSSESLSWFDHNTSSWRTSQQSLVTDWELYSETWPRAGTMQDGFVYELPMLAQITEETDGSYWLTPRANESGEKNETFIKRMGDRTDKCASSLSAQVKNPKTWPTPRASEYKDTGPVGSKSHTHMLGKEYLCAMVKEEDQPLGMLNPTWVEWLQNFPLGWTVLAGGKSNPESPE